MEKEKLRAKALKMYAELMVQKIKEVDASDWKKPWFGTDWFGQAQNINGRRYNNFNQILLSFISEEKGYKVPVFLTFNQAKEMGTSVLKGEKGFPVNLYTPIITDKEGNKISMEIYSSLTDAEKESYTVKHYTTFYHVFNIEQTNFKELQPEAWEHMLDRFSLENHAQGDEYVNPFVLINSKITFSIFFKGYVRATFAVKIMKYGYARVSTPDQCLNLQLDALRLYGVDHICEEKISGKNKNKPVLDALIAKLKTGDQLIVWKLDRLGRRTCELIKLQEALEKKNIALISLTEQLNTSTPIGKFAFHLLCCIAEMERNIISERTIAGLTSAKAKGRIGGRKPGLTDQAKRKAKLAAIEYTKYLQNEIGTIDDVCRIVGVSRATLYKYLRIEGINIQGRKR